MAHGQWTEIEARGVLEARGNERAEPREGRSWRGLVPRRLHWWKKKLGFDRALALLPVHVARSSRRRATRARRRGRP